MLSNLDATVLISPFADSGPFVYDGTVPQRQAQPFEVQDALGTVVMMPIDTTPRNSHTAVPAPSPLETVFADEDPMARMERKLDTALQHVAALQQRIASLDVTLARVLALL